MARANEQTFKRYLGQTEQGKLYDGAFNTLWKSKSFIFARIAFIFLKYLLLGYTTK